MLFDIPYPITHSGVSSESDILICRILLNRIWILLNRFESGFDVEIILSGFNPTPSIPLWACVKGKQEIEKWRATIICTTKGKHFWYHASVIYTSFLFSNVWIYLKCLFNWVNTKLNVRWKPRIGGFLLFCKGYPLKPRT